MFPSFGFLYVLEVDLPLFGICPGIVLHVRSTFKLLPPKTKIDNPGEKKILYKKKVIINFLKVVLGLLRNWVNIFESVNSTLESTLYKSILGFQYSIKGIKFLFLGVARMPYNEKKRRFMWEIY